VTARERDRILRWLDRAHLAATQALALAQQADVPHHMLTRIDNLWLSADYCKADIQSIETDGRGRRR
jgi:hypothetical protein